MCAEKYLMVQKPAFCICGTFCLRVVVCVCKSLFRMALLAILHFPALLDTFIEIYRFISTADSPYPSWSHICMQLTLFFCYFSPLPSHDLALLDGQFDLFTASSSHNIWSVSSSHQSSRLLLLRSPLIYHPPVKTTKAFTPTEHQHSLPIVRSRSFMTLLGPCLLVLVQVTDITSWKKWQHFERKHDNLWPHWKKCKQQDYFEI